eukprot:3975933-Alexandrium_andersonii.AAC.1
MPGSALQKPERRKSPNAPRANWDVAGGVLGRQRRCNEIMVLEKLESKVPGSLSGPPRQLRKPQPPKQPRSTHPGPSHPSRRCGR